MRDTFQNPESLGCHGMVFLCLSVCHFMNCCLLKNAFWDVQFSDPHRAITFDEMHANDHGLGGKHFWPQTKGFVEQLGNNAAKQIDDQYVMLSAMYS